MLCEASDVGLLSDARQKKGPMIVPLSVPLWFSVELVVEKRGGCGSVNVRMFHGNDLQFIDAFMVRQGVHRRRKAMVLYAGFDLVCLCILLVLTIQATGATTSIMSLAIDCSIEPSTAVKS